MLRGYETVLGDAGSDYELYLSEEFEERPMAEVAGVVAVCTRLQREGSHLTRRAEFAVSEVIRFNASRVTCDVFQFDQHSWSSFAGM